MEEWTDFILADSAMPEDEFTFTDGSNFGLDGFHFDQTMNEGVMDRARLPEVKGLSALPDGFVPQKEASIYDDLTLEDEVNGLNLTAFLDEDAIEKTANLADLDWLDPTSPQNPDRLPENSRDKSLEELANAWGFDSRTDGIQLIPNQDKVVADYNLSIKEGPKSGLPVGKEIKAAVKEAIRWAMRVSAQGTPPTKIKQGLVERLGDHARLTRKAMKMIEADHGLAGNVFLHAAAYPHIHKSRWAKALKKELRRTSARYVVVPKGEQRVAVWKSIGLRPVTKVPWKKALARYAPTLKATGHKVASKGDPKSVLQAAFLSGPREKAVEPSVKPVDIRPAERVSVQDAYRAFRTAPAIPRQAIDLSTRKEAVARKKALVQIARWVKSGQLEMKEAQRLARTTVAPAMILRTGAMLVKAAAAVSAEYGGVGNHYKVKQASISKQAAWKALAAAEAQVDADNREFEAGQRKKLAADLSGMAAKGLLTKSEAKKLAGLDLSVPEIRKRATLMAQSNHMRPEELPQVEERDFEGPIVTMAAAQRPKVEDHSPEQKRILAAAKKSGIKPREFKGLLKWARVQMTEGMAGEELNQMLRLRFSGPLLKAAKKMLKTLRSEHEGLSGFLYVDAAAYASKKGIKGCEKGALRHRANGLKAILAMDRCGACVLKNANGACTKYNKRLVEAVSVEDRDQVQRANIKRANASDAEVTASYFAPQYTNDFGLEDPLAEIGLHEAASPELLGEVLFGGLEL